MIGLPPGVTTTISGVACAPRRRVRVLGDGLAQLRKARRGPVVRGAALERVDGRLA